MIGVTVRFTAEQIRWLKEKAAKEKTSVSEVVRRCVERALRKEHEPTREEKWRRSMAVVGKFRSDVHDLGTNHDKYFVEAIEASWGRRKR